MTIKRPKLNLTKETLVVQPRVRTDVRAGGYTNHNLRVRTKVRAGGYGNHNLRVQTKIRAGGYFGNHNLAVR